MSGRKHSEETKEKIRLSKIGKPRDELTKEKLRVFRTGKKLEDIVGIEKAKEIKQKKRDFLNSRPDLKYQNKGKSYTKIMGEEKAKIQIDRLKKLKKELNPFYNKKHTEESRNKIKKSWTKERREESRNEMINGKSKYIYSFRDSASFSTKMSNICKNGHAAYMNHFIKNPSKPQVKLYNMILELCPYAILNYPCLNYSIDIAIPFLNLAIEYDEPWWHKNNEYDGKRQTELEEEGWNFIRFRDISKILNLKEKLCER